MELVTSANVEVASVEPAHVESEPADMEVADVEPADVEPSGVEPAHVESEPANMDVADVEPAGMEPAAVEPAGSTPAVVEPAGLEPADVEVANVEVAKFLTLDNPNAKIKWRCPKYMVKMLEEGSHSDTTLKAEDGTVKAHRSVLACISPVFASDFRMFPKLSSPTVRISNMSIDALKVFLLLLYTTKDNNDGGIPELHAAIDKHFEKLCEAFSTYQVSNLFKTVHISALARKLNPNNCWISYFQSLSDNNTTVTHTCYNYILGNYEEVIKSASILGAMNYMPDKVCLVLRKAESHSLRKKALQKFESKKRLAIEE